MLTQAALIGTEIWLFTFCATDVIGSAYLSHLGLVLMWQRLTLSRTKNVFPSEVKICNCWHKSFKNTFSSHSALRAWVLWRMGPGATTTTSASTALMVSMADVSSCVCSSWLLWRMTRHCTTSRCSVGKKEQIQLVNVFNDYNYLILYPMLWSPIIMESSLGCLGCLHCKKHYYKSTYELSKSLCKWCILTPHLVLWWKEQN